MGRPQFVGPVERESDTVTREDDFIYKSNTVTVSAGGGNFTLKTYIADIDANALSAASVYVSDWDVDNTSNPIEPGRVSLSVQVGEDGGNTILDYSQPILGGDVSFSPNLFIPEPKYVWPQIINRSQNKIEATVSLVFIDV